MGEDAMVDQDIADGAQIIKRLSANGISLAAALWAYNITLDTWRLIIAIPRQTSPSRSAVYSQIQDAITGLNLTLSLSRITLVFDTEPLIGTAKKFASDSVTDLLEIPFGGADIAGAPVDTGYVYRIDALLYEADLQAALQRMLQTDMSVRRPETITFVDGFDFDFILDSGARWVIIKAKALGRRLTSKDTERFTRIGTGTIRYYSTAALMIVSKSGFTPEALAWATQPRQQFGTLLNVSLVEWKSSADDARLNEALTSLLNDR